MRQPVALEVPPVKLEDILALFKAHPMPGLVYDGQIGVYTMTCPCPAGWRTTFTMTEAGCDPDAYAEDLWEDHVRDITGPWVFTFGAGSQLRNHYVKVAAPNYDAARACMWRHFGPLWSHQYAAWQFEPDAPYYTQRQMLLVEFTAERQDVRAALRGVAP
jgi:hypothetical protein